MQTYPDPGPNFAFNNNNPNDLLDTIGVGTGGALGACAPPPKFFPKVPFFQDKTMGKMPFFNEKGALIM